MIHSAVIITCNSAEFIESNLRHHAPHFDRVIVCDGPSLPRHPETVGNGLRLTGGKPYSTDGTPGIVKKVMKDHQNVRLLARGDPWPGKVAKFNFALQHIQPGYIWQIDVDEFWHGHDIERLKAHLDKHSQYTAVEFWAWNFWGTVRHYTKMKIGGWGNKPPWRRIFRYDRGCKWTSHEPPRMTNKSPEKILTRTDTFLMGIYMYHYGYCKLSQLEAREKFYGLSRGQLTGPMIEWRKTKPKSSTAGELCVFGGRHPINPVLFTE